MKMKMKIRERGGKGERGLGWRCPKQPYHVATYRLDPQIMYVLHGYLCRYLPRYLTTYMYASTRGYIRNFNKYVEHLVVLNYLQCYEFIKDNLPTLE